MIVVQSGRAENLSAIAERELAALKPGMEQLKGRLRNADDNQKLQLNKEFVLSIGDRVEDIVKTVGYEVSDRARFAETLWEVAAKNYTKKTPSELQRFYYALKQGPGPMEHAPPHPMSQFGHPMQQMQMQQMQSRPQGPVGYLPFASGLPMNAKNQSGSNNASSNPYGMPPH